MPGFPPVWTESTVIAAQVLARGATLRGTLDLRTRQGAFLFLRLGRGGTNALTDGVDVLVRRLWANGAAGGAHPTAPRLTSQTAAAASHVVAGQCNAGQAELILDSVASYAVGDIVSIQDADGGVTRLEFARIAKLTIGSGTGVTLSAPLGYPHTAAQADTVRSKADVWEPMWLPGGATYEVIFDYANDAAGDSVTVQALAQVFVRDEVAV